MNLVLPTANDPLGEILHFLRMSGNFYCHSELTAPWAVEMPALQGFMMLHVVTSGACCLEVDKHDVILQPGDLALLPRCEGHLLASAPGMAGVKLFDTHREQLSDRYEILKLGGGGKAATLLCGVFQCDHPAARHLVTLLPPVIVVEAWNSPSADWIQSTVRTIGSEARELRPGGETIITRLADILVIHAIRSWIAVDPAAQSGWFGALRDRRLGPVIAKIHRDPCRAWTLESLASEAAMSRSAFASSFTERVGEPAMHYVTRWKMHTAATWLGEEDVSVAELARRLGYDSEAAFSRAFKRFVGVSPGSLRKRKQKTGYATEQYSTVNGVPGN